MLSRLPHIACFPIALALLHGCSDSNESTEASSGQASTVDSSKPSWALSEEEQRQRAAEESMAKEKMLGPVSDKESAEFDSIWNGLQAGEQSYLIFAKANEPDLQRLDVFLENYPNSRYREKALYLAAIARWSSYNWEGAAGRYQAYLAEFPRHQRSSLARMRHAQSLVKSDRAAEAIQRLDEYKSFNLAFQRELVRAEALAALGRVDEAKSLLRSWMVSPEAMSQQERTMFEARKLLERIESIEVQAPAFDTYAYNSGEQISTDRFLGNVLLIDFWKSTCNPCMTELPLIADLYETYHADGFDVLAVNMDTNVNSMEQAMEIIGADWPVYHDGKAHDGDLALLFGVTRCPHTILIDRDGIIRAVDVRYDTLKRMVPELLKQPASN